MSNSSFTSTSLSSSAATPSSSSVQAIISSIAASVSSQVLGGSTVTVDPSTTHVVTSIISASSEPPTTNIITSVVTQSPPSADETGVPVTVVLTSANNPTTTTVAVAGTSLTSASASSTSPGAASLVNSGSSNGGSGSSGLSAAGKTAVAVVVPVAVVALLVLIGLFLWRKRKQKKTAEEDRRKEVEEYGFNPNDNPNLPNVASGSPEMAQDHSSGYRGWGTASSNPKASMTLSGGHTQGQLSDTESKSAAYGSPHSPSGAGSDGHSGDLLVNNRGTMNSDELGALDAGHLSASNRPVRRGPSNASSHYSAADRSDHSDERPEVPPLGQAYTSHGTGNGGGYGYGQAGPYGDGTYGSVDAGMPVVRDVPARRNARVEQASNYGNGRSGIAQNF